MNMQLRAVCALIGADPNELGPMLEQMPYQVHYLFNCTQRMERKLDLLLEAENERRQRDGGNAIQFERTPNGGG